MDRLHVVALAAAWLALAAAGCGDENKDSASGSSRDRVNAVKATPEKKVDPAAMCDKYYAPGAGPEFAWPELTGPAPDAPDGWRWVNIWATWCKPCVHELSYLPGWSEKLSVSLELVSADESAEEVEAFRAEHPATPDSHRLADPDAVGPWVEGYGVPGAGLPVHILVDPDGKVRCVRASEIAETDYAAIEALVGS